ncbi:MAG: D-tyrosyl-tRNA(Tyr) deacylase [Bryobacteraceae bacterium]|nr:D-tyrosyl-tRNA(Tyr) deacylase [Bryobacteraceae bacterium]
MRALLQRVSEARVDVDGVTAGRIGPGLLILLGVARGDTESDAEQLASKVSQLRIFADAEGKMNRSLLDTSGSALIVSQFTLYGDTRKGRRPSFDLAAPPEEARRLYELFCDRMRAVGVPVETGIFQAMMSVHLVNDGPVTLLVESGRG